MKFHHCCHPGKNPPDAHATLGISGGYHENQINT